MYFIGAPLATGQVRPGSGTCVTFSPVLCCHMSGVLCDLRDCSIHDQVLLSISVVCVRHVLPRGGAAGSGGGRAGGAQRGFPSASLRHPPQRAGCGRRCQIVSTNTHAHTLVPTYARAHTLQEREIDNILSLYSESAGVPTVGSAASPRRTTRLRTHPRLHHRQHRRSETHQSFSPTGACAG